MKRNYVRPRVAVVSVNVEGVCLRHSWGGNSSECPPVMGTDDPNENINYWEL